MKLLNKKQFVLMLVISSSAFYFLAFLIGAICGLTIEYGYYSAEYYKSYIFEFYENAIPVYVIGGIFLILIPFTVAFYKDKLKRIKLHKFMSGFDYFAISLFALFQFIIMTYYRGDMTPAGVAFTVFIFTVFLTSLFASIYCYYEFFKMLNVKEAIYKKVKKHKEENLKSTAVEKLLLLKDLLDKKAITEEEYNEKKKQYIDYL